MWCTNCQSEVAAGVSSDNQHVNCATCGGELARTAPQFRKEAQHARDLLERWSSSELLDAMNRRRPNSTDQTDSSERTPHGRQDNAATKTRIDAAHLAEAPTVLADNTSAPPDKTASASTSAESPSAEAHVVNAQPRDASTDATPTTPAKSASTLSKLFASQSNAATNWQSFTGQILAYIGVVALTGGAACVLVSYYSGPASWAPSGWLIVLTGQMLLFLGLIALVAGSLENSTAQVVSRIDALGNRLARIERTVATMTSTKSTPPIQPPAQRPTQTSPSKPSTRV